MPTPHVIVTRPEPVVPPAVEFSITGLSPALFMAVTRAVGKQSGGDVGVLPRNWNELYNALEKVCNKERLFLK